MPLRFQTLENVPFETLYTCLRLAFSDYIVPWQPDPEAFRSKLKRDNFVPALAPAAFDGDRMVGFILHSRDTLDGRDTVYNSATGVIPEYRGQRIPAAMYNFILPHLQQAGVTHSVLEVIDLNKPAVRVYERRGFSHTRKLTYHEGVIPATDAQLRVLEGTDLNIFRSWWDWAPSWQNHIPASSRIMDKYELLGMYNGEDLVAFALFDPQTGLVPQFAVHPAHRRKGHGKALFSALMARGPGRLKLVNMDKNDAPTQAFLDALGLERKVEQFEMLWEVPPGGGL